MSDSKDLPTYKDAVSGATNEILQPVVLVLSSTTIHAESDPSNVLYKLERAVAQLGASTKQVEFSRMQHTVQGDIEQGDSQVKNRPKHIYTLYRPYAVNVGSVDTYSGSTGILGMSKKTHYYIKTTSKRLGFENLGFKLCSSGHWAAVPVDTTGCTEIDFPPFVKNGKAAFEIREKAKATQKASGPRSLFKKKSHTDSSPTEITGDYVWSDDKGNIVAMEYAGLDAPRLAITASLHRQVMDTLVALWCSRVWQLSASSNKAELPGPQPFKQSENPNQKLFM